jgi:transposase-like protein
MPKHHYTPEFRAEAVAMCHHGDRSCAQVAEDLGVSYTTHMTW